MQPSAPALAWGIPFVGLLGSMAVVPILAPRFWHRRMGLVALFWGAILVAQQTVATGIAAAAAGVCQLHLGAPLGEAGDAALTLAADRVAVRRVEVG